MKNKFILINKVDNSRQEFKTFKDIAKHLNIEFHQARSIYITRSKGKKHMFLITKLLCEKYDIIDNPDYINVLH